MVRNIVWLLIAALELFFAGNSANAGNIAETILYCFSCYICFHFMEKGEGGGVK